MPEVDIKVVNDTLSPKLKKLLQDSGELSKNVLKAMGNSLQSQVVQSFANPSKRIESWPPKKDKTPSTLQKSTTLRASFVLKSDARRASVSTPVKYAPFHQFGTRSGLPRRPFFPFRKDGKIWERTEKILKSAAQFRAGQPSME